MTPNGVWLDVMTQTGTENVAVRNQKDVTPTIMKLDICLSEKDEKKILR